MIELPHRLKALARLTVGAVLLAAASLAAPAASAFETSAPRAFLMDYGTGTVLFEKEPDTEMPPASMLKLMTLAVIFDQLKAGKLKLEDQFFVSENAWRTGGAASGSSTMFLPLNSQVSVDDLIKGIIIQSGNDATIAAAEGIAGSVEAFADMMNRRAKEIGLTHSHFMNPHGLPDPQQHMTVRDLAILANYLIHEHPEFYHLFSEEEFTFNGIKQHNRNPLLALGADGLKTGHTSEAGYGLVASAERDGRRIILAVAGMKTVKERAEEASKLMNFGLAGFEEIVLVKPGEVFGEAKVEGGVVKSVPLAAKEEVRVLAPKGGGNEYEKAASFSGALPAPVAAGTEFGEVAIIRNGEAVRSVKLATTAAVEEAGLMQRMQEYVYSYFE
ncbi:D-alanyl-D-alanine carboxypeptidase family protein [Mangrovicella endophytica]|uniref:D-alanyl-D-alanine carboxypeptidase family protein n=1 Tax=Mangrovicella endophytica TaxID=2066697 RepID=UPI000C9E65B0|nr:D-alanyl-D-alanine carboxypeptidase family protein [Mangrovicella endophytica]